MQKKFFAYLFTNKTFYCFSLWFFIGSILSKLEDGSDEDLKVLEEKTVEINQEVEAKSEDKSGNVEENSDDENVDYDNIKSI